MFHDIAYILILMGYQHFANSGSTEAANPKTTMSMFAGSSSGASTKRADPTFMGALGHHFILELGLYDHHEINFGVMSLSSHDKDFCFKNACMIET